MYIYTQVCIPGLHISLGIFNRLYSLLENACHELDLLQAEDTGAGDTRAGTSFGQYSAALRRLSEVQTNSEAVSSTIPKSNIPRWSSPRAG